MKKLVGLFAIMALMATPALAQDGNVSKDTLSALGIGGIQMMSDDQGMEVRGMSSNAQSTSLSLFGLVVFDPNTGSTIQLNGSHFGRGTAENAGLNANSAASTATAAGSTAILGTIVSLGNTFSVDLSAIGVAGTGAASGN